MGKFTTSTFFVAQWTPLGPPLYADLTGKTVVVIGGNTGIGFETAKHFARMKPARLILGCRSEERGQAATRDIARATGHATEIRQIDLADFSSVVAFADGLKDTPIDILVANAGLGRLEYVETKDGWEDVLQVNHLGTSLVSLLLVPNLVRAGKEKHTTSRLVLTSSSTHMVIPAERLASMPDLKTLGSSEYCTASNMLIRYQLTKLLNVLFVRALAERLPLSTPLVPTSVNPGFCTSEFRRFVTQWSFRARMKFMEIILGRTAEQGSRSLLWAALGPDGEEGPHLRYMRGVYVSEAGLDEPGDNVMSKEGYEFQERIWHDTIDTLAEVAPTIRSIVSEYLQ